MIDTKEKKKRRRKIHELVESSGSQNEPTSSVLALCEQFCNGNIDNELFRREYFRQLPDWSEHHWHFRYGRWWESLSDEEQFNLTNKYGTLGDIALALIKEGILPDLRSELAKQVD
ncbi:hypothetical protein [Citrobacter portucalensis]|uniref:hypothetical protein n=1 Tax=Citrobacter portucalensis TaxID=1639133 RepID=UPI0028894BF6|nr:hypothetical protein [Citrobacter portucalensis]WNI84132.1 hypothetical protein RIK60_00325 [Citrobacter portucalensis]